MWHSIRRWLGWAMNDLLPAARSRLADRVVLAHLDAGNGDIMASRVFADEVTPLEVDAL